MGIGTKFDIFASAGGTPFVNAKSIDFDGSDDHLKGGSTFTTLDGATQASFSLWVKPVTGGSTLRYLFQIGRGSTGHNSQCQLFLYAGNRIDFSIYTSSYFGRGDISAMTYDAWNHILIVIDLPSATEFKIYVNGSDATTGDNMSTRSSFPSATDELYVAETETGNYNPLLGHIDEFAIWEGTVLSAANAATIYNSGVPTDLSTFSTPPDHWWRMGDGDTYPTITDQIGSYDLTMTNQASGDIEDDVPS